MGTALATMQRTGPLTEAEEDAAWFVIDRVLLGLSLRRIEEEGGPTRSDFMNFLSRSTPLVHYYNRAREISAFEFEDRSLFLAEELAEIGGNNPNEIRRKTAFIEHLKWMAKVRNPAVFGDKSLVQVTVPIQINTNMDLGEQDGARQVGHTYSIQAKPIRELRPEEIPTGHTVVDVGEGYVGIVPKTDQLPAPSDPEEGKGEGRAEDTGASANGSAVHPASASGGEGEAPPAPKHRARPSRASAVSKRKASKVEGESP